MEDSKKIEDYIKYLGNIRAKGLGFGNLYEGYTKVPDSMKWVEEYADQASKDKLLLSKAISIF